MLYAQLHPEQILVFNHLLDTIKNYQTNAEQFIYTQAYIRL